MSPPSSLPHGTHAFPYIAVMGASDRYDCFLWANHQVSQCHLSLEPHFYHSFSEDEVSRILFVPNPQVIQLKAGRWLPPAAIM